MATPKTWTAEDLKMGVLRLSVEDGILLIMNGYSFVDAAGDVIPQLPKKTVSISHEYGILPANIRLAIEDLTEFCYAQALEDEGMED